MHRYYYTPRCNQTYVRCQLEALLARYRAAGKRVLAVIWEVPRGTRPRYCTAGITATTNAPSVKG